MPRPKKELVTQDSDKAQVSEIQTNTEIPCVSDIEWTDYVLSMLSEDEKIKGNPTTDGLRRILEPALNCTVIESLSSVVQSPDPNNEKRATVVHTISFITTDNNKEIKKTISGAADVYWGNCDKIYRNHPVAVAETRAEGRALRRALRLRKVVAAEEIVDHVEDTPDQNSVNKITNNQINFIDVIGQRLNISISKLLDQNGLDSKNIYNISHENAVNIIRILSKYQQDMSSISEDLLGYHTEWK